MIQRVRIIHEYDLFKGKIGYVVEEIDQHSLCTYVVTFKGMPKDFRRAYQRKEIKFLNRVKKWKLQ